MAPAIKWFISLTVKADQKWVSDFQFFNNPVDFSESSPQWGYAAKKVKQWRDAGYFATDVAQTSVDDALISFESGKSPLLMGGTWLDSSIQNSAVTFEWDKFQNPGNLSVGSAVTR